MPSLKQRIYQRLGLVRASDVAQQVEAAQMQGVRRAMSGAMQQQRTLLAALTTNDTASWQADGLHVNASTEAGLAVVRARSRDAALNNPWAKRFTGMVLRNVLGPKGVRYQSRVRVGSTGALNTSINDRLEAAWKTWGRRGNCDVTGQYSWAQVQRLALRHWAVDGESFIRLLPGRGPHAFQVQVLPPEMVPLNTRSDLGDGRKVRQGIEVDAEGRVLAYYVRTDSAALDSLGVFEATATPRGLRRVPAAEMLHLFTPEQAGQLRGIPWMAAGLKPAYQAQDFASAGLNKARESAKRGGWIEGDPDLAPPPGASQMDGLSDGKDASGTPFQTLQDGTWERLPDGLKATAFESDYPNIEYGQFIKDCLRNVASAFECAYITLGNDLEAVNYSSGQLGLEDERTLWKTLQHRFSEEDFCAPVHRMWLRYALLAAPGLSGLNYDRLEQYADAAAWQCHRWTPLDRLKHIEAQRSGIEGRITSPQREIVANGDDPDEVLAELLDWQTKTAGLRPAESLTPPAPAPSETDQAQARHMRLIASRAME
jgi:lambda family phage portal protein